jgi:hypothetical protein
MEHVQRAFTGGGDSFTVSLEDGDREQPASNERKETTINAVRN